jgi:MFS family permease
LIIKPLISFLGVKELPERAQSLVQKAIITITLIQLFFGLSSTFYVLFVIDLVGYEQLGILLAISFVLQALIDYPSGVFGDWVGQKWLLLVAYLSFGISYGLMFFADSFASLLVVYCIQAFAASQASGALQTWLENNYKIAVGDADPQRKTFRMFFGRYNMIGSLVLGLSFIAGGVIATFHSRQDVFAIQAIALAGLAIAFLFIIKDYPEIKRSEKSVRNYFKLMGGGLKAVFMNKTVLLFVIGICFDAAKWIIWGNMILFPLYFGYTGSDGAASMYRFIVFLAGIPAMGIAANIAAKLHIKWQPILVALHTVLFFGSFMIITTWFPFRDTFEPLALILTFIVLIGINLFFYIPNILQQRIFLDLIPDENRNAVYSLIPTVLLLVNAPAVASGGQLLTSWGSSATLFVLGLIGLIGSFFFYISLRSLQPSALDQLVSE